MKTLFFICGSTGAGKTTYAKSLCAKTGGFHLTIDEFMKTLYWMDAPTPPTFEWAQERVKRCEAVIQSISEKAAACGIPVVLDLGFSERTQREKFRSWAESIGCRSELHFLDVPKDERWKRVQERNKAPGNQSIMIDQKTFDWMESYFQAPESEENPVVIRG